MFPLPGFKQGHVSQHVNKTIRFVYQPFKTGSLAGLLFFWGMKKTVLLFSVLLSLAACAQLNKTIAKVSAYYTIPIPGTIMVDEAGKQVPPPRTKVYTVYLEKNGTPPQSTKAWVDGSSFTPVAGATGTDSVIVGKSYADGKKIVWKASKHTVLFRLELSPEETTKRLPQKLGSDQLLLEGRFNGKAFYYTISGLIQLASPEYP